MKWNEYFKFKQIDCQNVDNSTAKVNVLFIIIQMNMMGGSERLVYNLISKLDRQVFNPSVAWFYGDKPLQEFLELGIPLFHVPKNGRFDFSPMRSLGEIIKKNQIAVVNAHHFFSMIYAFFGTKLRNRSSLIYTEHSEWEVQGISQKWRIIGRSLLKRIDHVVGVGPQVTEQLKNVFRLPESKVSTIENGVALEEFRSCGQDLQEIRCSLNLKDGERVIGTVGNFRRVKNHIFLIKAFGELVKTLENVKLVLIGRGYSNDLENSELEVRDKIRELGIGDSVPFLGSRSDVSKLLGIMDVFCLTSFKEGLPISLIEAMAAGLPVVGTNVEGIRDVIRPDYNGLLVEPGDVEGLKNTLMDLLKHPDRRERLGRAARQTAEEKYSLDRCVAQYEKLFLSTLPSSERYRLKNVPD